MDQETKITMKRKTTISQAGRCKKARLQSVENKQAIAEERNDDANHECLRFKTQPLKKEESDSEFESNLRCDCLTDQQIKTEPDSDSDFHQSVLGVTLRSGESSWLTIPESNTPTSIEINAKQEQSEENEEFSNINPCILIDSMKKEPCGEASKPETKKELPVTASEADVHSLKPCICLVRKLDLQEIQRYKNMSADSCDSPKAVQKKETKEKAPQRLNNQWTIEFEIPGIQLEPVDENELERDTEFSLLNRKDIQEHIFTDEASETGLITDNEKHDVVDLCQDDYAETIQDRSAPTVHELSTNQSWNSLSFVNVADLVTSHNQAKSSSFRLAQHGLIKKVRADSPTAMLGQDDEIKSESEVVKKVMSQWKMSAAKPPGLFEKTKCTVTMIEDSSDESETDAAPAQVHGLYSGPGRIARKSAPDPNSKPVVPVNESPSSVRFETIPPMDLNGNLPYKVLPYEPAKTIFPTPRNRRRRPECSTPGCRGVGHVEVKYSTHRTAAGCPLAAMNRYMSGPKHTKNEMHLVVLPKKGNPSRPVLSTCTETDIIKLIAKNITKETDQTIHPLVYTYGTKKPSSTNQEETDKASSKKSLHLQFPIPPPPKPQPPLPVIVEDKATSRPSILRRGPNILSRRSRIKLQNNLMSK